MPEEKKDQPIKLQMIQKTSILGTDKEGNTTYKISFFLGDQQLKSKTGMEVYAIEVLNKEGVLIRYEMYGEIPDGKVVEYYENGQIMVEKNYFNGQKNGAYKVYYPSGALWKEGKFASDQIVRLKTYSETGKLLSDKIFVEIVAVRTGNTEVFYKNGREIARWTYEKDGTIKKYGETIDGIVKYYVGKILKEEHTYDDGYLVSIKKYNKKGQVLSERTFEKGSYPPTV
jgi:antitoxin component YwqK of YwqJK toxin-antitoxin module